MIRVREVGEDEWTDVHDDPYVLDAEDAAGVACDRWYEGARWAGEKMPEWVECEVDFNGALSLVTVHVDWSPCFTGVSKAGA